MPTEREPGPRRGLLAVRNTAFPREAALQAKVVPGRGRAGGHLVPHAPLPLAWRAGALARSEAAEPTGAFPALPQHRAMASAVPRTGVL